MARGGRHENKDGAGDEVQHTPVGQKDEFSAVCHDETESPHGGDEQDGTCDHAGFESELVVVDSPEHAGESVDKAGGHVHVGGPAVTDVVEWRDDFRHRLDVTRRDADEKHEPDQTVKSARAEGFRYAKTLSARCGSAGVLLFLKEHQHADALHS